MDKNEVATDILNYLYHLEFLEFAGLVFGFITVLFLIRQNILTWISGIIYIFISFIIFWKARLYGDFILHIVFLVLNIYGWIFWVKGRSSQFHRLEVSKLSIIDNLKILTITIVGIFIFAQFLIFFPGWVEGIEPASLPYWDSTTSVLSITGMWLSAQKKIENWYYWFIVDIIASAIYLYKGLYFYSFLYLIYVPLAITGYKVWEKSTKTSWQS